MNDRDKDLDEKLQLRLIAVTEDPTVKERRNKSKMVFGAISESDFEMRNISKNNYGKSIH